jgi:hypothetical protein
VIQELGRAPTSLGFRTERLELWVERSGGTFEPTPIVMESAEIRTMANGVPFATIEIGCAADPTLESPPAPIRDWQLWDGTRKLDVLAFFGNGRRIQLRTARSQPSNDWCLFEGFVERIERSWGGRSQPIRGLRLHCLSTIIAADRQRSQYFIGQWRRSRVQEQAAIDAQNGEALTDCRRVTSVPMIFNPDGKPNCHPLPMKFRNRKVWLPCDEGKLRGVLQPQHWTVARMLRYVHWASLQPALPLPDGPGGSGLDIPDESAEGLFEELAWSSYNLAHLPDWSSGRGPGAAGEIGPNLDYLIRDLLEIRTPVAGLMRHEVLLRRPANICIDGMSVLEAYAHICDMAGLLFYVEHDVTTGGEVKTFVRFVIRGNKTGSVQGPPPPGSAGPGETIVERVVSTRNVFLSTASDRTSTAGQSDLTRVKNASCTDGQIVHDLSQIRQEVLVVGGGTEYEMTPPPLTLRPGWKPNEDWDVDPEDEATIVGLIAAAGEPEWQEKYGASRPVYGEHANVGRLWVLNEDGYFAANEPAPGGGTQRSYQREWSDHPWGTAASWEPYKFRTDGRVFELANRGDAGFVPRRRRFLPLYATNKEAGNYLGTIGEISFDAGATWYAMQSVGCETPVLQDRCGIRLDATDLSQVPSETFRENNGLAADTSIYSAYLRGQLRIRVTANIEGDDAVRYVARNQAPAFNYGPNWTELIHRGGELPRALRHVPGQEGTPAARNTLFESDVAQWIAGDNRDGMAEAEALAKRLRKEFITPRVSGRARIPWLWRDGYGPTDGYRIGDEIVGISTGEANTFINFGLGRSIELPGTRIVAINYTYSEGEQSTELQLEDDALTPDAITAMPSVGRQYAAREGPAATV